VAYYLNPEGAMMAATITVTGSTLAPGVPVVLFPTRISAAVRVPDWIGRTTLPPTGAS
jgi:hypothetical protein